MRRSFAIGIGFAAVIAAALALRLHEAPYIDVINGKNAQADSGLRAKAEKGDGFAALLVAKNYVRGVVGGTPDRDKAIEWYVTAARSGEIRAIVPFIDLTLTRGDPTPDRCQAYVPLLDLVGRTGEVPALMVLGHYYETGFCVDADLTMAARYYMSAARIDSRMYEAVDAIAPRLPPGAARDMKPRLETFDADQSVAIAQFLAVAPSVR